ncbi:MAG: hypothetical protein ACJ71B_10725 [Nitrososphaera sp.]
MTLECKTLDTIFNQTISPGGSYFGEEGRGGGEQAIYLTASD